MRILLTADPLLPVPPGGYGGIERIVDALVRALRARGHRVGLVARAGSTCPSDALYPWPGGDPGTLLGSTRNALALARAVRAFRPDLVHNFSRLAHLLLLLPARLPKIMSYQRHVSLRSIRLALAPARRGSLRFTACSDFLRLRAAAGGGEWTTIHNFVDLDRIDHVPAVAPDAPLLFLSRLDRIKAPDLAIAIARRAGRRLVLAGNIAPDGPDAAFFREAISPSLGRDGIEYVGEVDDRRKNTLLGAAAALLVPIRWDEPFGIVFAEALAAGTPLLTCARGALPEIVRPDRTGYFIPEGDIEAGAAAVRRLGLLDRAACRADAAARFSPAVATDRYLALYADALAGRPHSPPCDAS
jgi:glycosyltransferase involved in cell wall biosynthesis